MSEILLNDLESIQQLQPDTFALNGRFCPFRELTPRIQESTRDTLGQKTISSRADGAGDSAIVSRNHRDELAAVPRAVLADVDRCQNRLVRY